MAGAGDGMSANFAGMSKNQLYDIMCQMKQLIEQNQQQARQILVQNPLLTRALFQAQIMLGMLQPPQVVPSNHQPAASQNLSQSAQLPPQPVIQPSLPQGSVGLPDQPSMQGQLPPRQVPNQLVPNAFETGPPITIPSPSISLQHPHMAQQAKGHLSTQIAQMPLPHASQVTNAPPSSYLSISQPSSHQSQTPVGSNPMQQPFSTNSMLHPSMQPPLPSQPRPPLLPNFHHQPSQQIGPGFHHSTAPQMLHSQSTFHNMTCVVVISQLSLLPVLVLFFLMDMHHHFQISCNLSHFIRVVAHISDQTLAILLEIPCRPRGAHHGCLAQERML
uniref:Cleavage stimulation factor subunit 2 hinge domain-containing protein n=1 Tax=Kalanchoe fedtschenkoi TaxID=63787 RepID=A0A7N0TTZ6_KALFE